MSLVHYGFSREEVLWMPLTEAQDYIHLINQQVEEEKNETVDDTPHINETPTIKDVYRNFHL